MVKVYVGNLNSEITSRDLREHFAVYGEVEDCKKVHNKPFGFVHMRDIIAAEIAESQLSGIIIKGSRIVVRILSNKIQKFYVGNLTRDTTEYDLRKLFENEGAFVVTAEKVDERRIGFVRIEILGGFKQTNELVRILNGSFLKGNRIVVEESEMSPSTRESPHDRSIRFTDHSSRRSCSISNSSPDSQKKRRSNSPDFKSGERSIYYVENAGHADQSDQKINMKMNETMPTVSVGPRIKVEPEDYYSPPSLNSGNFLSTEKIIAEINTDFKVMHFDRSASLSKQMLETGLLTDYEFHCEGKIFPIHKAIIAGKSPVLLRNINCGNIYIKDVDSITMKLLFQFMYSGQFDVNDINPIRIMKLLAASDLYQIELVKEGLEVALVNNLDENNAVDYLTLSEELQFQNLKKVTKQFICERVTE